MNTALAFFQLFIRCSIKTVLKIIFSVLELQRSSQVLRSQPHAIFGFKFVNLSQFKDLFTIGAEKSFFYHILDIMYEIIMI